jgi:hypothetical protein
MRIPVFARGANPRIDRPILKKSKSYADEQVALANADYIDPSDPAKGIICRELLYFGARPVTVKTADLSTLPLSEIPGVRFVGPRNPVPHFVSTLSPDQGWDWAQERASA